MHKEETGLFTEYILLFKFKFKLSIHLCGQIAGNVKYSLY